MRASMRQVYPIPVLVLGVGVGVGAGYDHEVTTGRHVLDPELTILGGRDFVGLVGRLCRERSWATLTVVFGAVGRSEGGLAFVSLTDVDAAARLLSDALAHLTPPKNPRAGQADELRALRLSAAEALLARSSRPPLTELERRALERAAALMAAAGDHRRAATTYEELGQDARAGDAWGAIGDLERREAALAREEARGTARREAVDAMRRFDTLLSAGERRAALALAHLFRNIEEGATAQQLAGRIDARLVRGGGVNLRIAGETWCRVGGLPAVIGRDRTAEVMLRDPAVSRRHAILRAAADGITVEDAGSRGGIRVGGARVDAPLPLRGSGELGFGDGTTLAFTATEHTVLLEGRGGLDRSLRALVGVDMVSLAPLFPGADGLSLAFAGGGARLVRRPDVAVRVEGQFIGPGCDLLHGDVVEIGAPVSLRLEVE
jgi:Inner membrane component of T3SS, cytoplasmic domain